MQAATNACLVWLVPLWGQTALAAANVKGQMVSDERLGVHRSLSDPTPSAVGSDGALVTRSRYTISPSDPINSSRRTRARGLQKHQEDIKPSVVGRVPDPA